MEIKMRRPLSIRTPHTCQRAPRNRQEICRPNDSAISPHILITKKEYASSFFYFPQKLLARPIPAALSNSNATLVEIMTGTKLSWQGHHPSLFLSPWPASLLLLSLVLLHALVHYGITFRFTSTVFYQIRSGPVWRSVCPSFYIRFLDPSWKQGIAQPQLQLASRSTLHCLLLQFNHFHLWIIQRTEKQTRSNHFNNKTSLCFSAVS